MCESVFKVLVIGDSNVGKTAMVARYCHNKWLAHYKVTLGGNKLKAVCLLQPIYVHVVPFTSVYANISSVICIQYYIPVERDRVIIIKFM